MLDEATSALDAGLTSGAGRTGNLMKDRTTFVIAHRLSALPRGSRSSPSSAGGSPRSERTRSWCRNRAASTCARLARLRAFDEHDADRPGDVAETLTGPESELEEKST